MVARRTTECRRRIGDVTDDAEHGFRRPFEGVTGRARFIRSFRFGMSFSVLAPS